MMILLGPLIGFATSIAFFVSVIVVIWLSCRHKERMQELAQAERFRRLELNLEDVDADLARTAAERGRRRLIGLIGLLVPVAICLSLCGMTVLVLLFLRGDPQTVLLTSWALGLVVCLATAGLSLWLLGRREEAPKASKSVTTTANNEAEHPVLTGIREGPMER